MTVSYCLSILTCQRCISHTLHLGLSHFIKTLRIPGITATKKSLRRPVIAQNDSSTPVDDSDDEELAPEDEYDEDLDVNTSMEVEANEGDPAELLSTQDVEFTAGDALGKLLAFINQLRSCSEPTRLYFEKLCRVLGIPPRKLKLWVRTRWGSLYDCLITASSMKKVCTQL